MSALALTGVAADYPEHEEQIKRFVETGVANAPIVKQ